MVAIDLSPEVRELVARHLESGKYNSANELIRAALATLRQSESDMEAIREGIADMEAGRTRPLSEVAVEIGHKYGFDAK